MGAVIYKFSQRAVTRLENVLLAFRYKSNNHADVLSVKRVVNPQKKVSKRTDTDSRRMKEDRTQA